MTIKIQAYQSGGIKTDHIVDKYEFCCWDDLKKWLNNPKLIPHKCPECKKKTKK